MSGAMMGPLTLLDTERAASKIRTDTERAERMRGVRARTLRIEYPKLVDRARQDRQKRPTMEDVARRLWGKWSDEQIARVVADATANQHGGKHVARLTERETKDIAKRYLEAHATPESVKSVEVYRHVSRHGTPHYVRTSFGTLLMTTLRKELGIVYVGAGTRSRAVAQADGDAGPQEGDTVEGDGTGEALPPANDSDRNELKTSTITGPIPVDLPPVEPPQATPEGVRAAMEIDPPAPDLEGLRELRDQGAIVHGVDLARPGGEGESILVEIPGGRLTATRRVDEGDNWRVEFIGFVSGTSVRLLTDELKRHVDELTEGAVPF